MDLQPRRRFLIAGIDCKGMNHHAVLRIGHYANGHERLECPRRRWPIPASNDSSRSASRRSGTDWKGPFMAGLRQCHPEFARPRPAIEQGRT